MRNSDVQGSRREQLLWGFVSCMRRRTVQEDFVLNHKSVVKIRKRTSPFNPVEKFPGLQEIFSLQIPQISDPSLFLFHRPGAGHFSPPAFLFSKTQSGAMFPATGGFTPRIGIRCRRQIPLNSLHFPLFGS
jgi:hypothetical protein